MAPVPERYLGNVLRRGRRRPMRSNACASSQDPPVRFVQGRQPHGQQLHGGHLIDVPPAHRGDGQSPPMIADLAHAAGAGDPLRHRHAPQVASPLHHARATGGAPGGSSSASTSATRKGRIGSMEMSGGGRIGCGAGPSRTAAPFCACGASPVVAAALWAHLGAHGLHVLAQALDILTGGPNAGHPEPGGEATDVCSAGPHRQGRRSRLRASARPRTAAGSKKLVTPFPATPT